MGEEDRRLDEQQGGSLGLGRAPRVNTYADVVGVRVSEIVEYTLNKLVLQHRLFSVLSKSCGLYGSPEHLGV